MVSENIASTVVILTLSYLKEAVCNVIILGQIIVYAVHAQGEKAVRSQIQNQLYICCQRLSMLYSSVYERQSH